GVFGIVRSPGFATILKTGPLSAASARWSGPAPLQNEWRPAFARDAAALSERYDSAEGGVLVFAHDYVLGQGMETALSSRVLVVEELGPWRVADSNDITAPNARKVRSVQVLGPQGTQLEVWIWRLVNGEPADAPLSAMWLQLRSWLEWKVP